VKSPLALCLCLVALCLVATPPDAFASNKPADRRDAAKKKAEPAPSDEDAKIAEFESQLNFKRGRIELPGGVAALDVPEGFRYLPPEQVDKILADAWGNPPGMKTLGMLFPTDVSPLKEGGWGVVITYSDDGHVDDSDAASIDYDALLKQMKEESEADNREREKEGYEPGTLVGWATPPHYDQASHKLYWAREFNFRNAPENTLNYDIRVLGREGVLSLNAVAGMSKLPDIEGRMKEVMSFADFKPGRRYADYSSSTDKLAAYGIGALVAGKVAAKVGFFKLILGGLLAAKKLVVVAFAAVAGFFARLFRRNKG
jgi:uncharacterized membrane-anchored protein